MSIIVLCVGGWICAIDKRTSIFWDGMFWICGQDCELSPLCFALSCFCGGRNLFLVLVCCVLLPVQLSQCSCVCRTEVNETRKPWKRQAKTGHSVQDFDEDFLVRQTSLLPSLSHTLSLWYSDREKKKKNNKFGREKNRRGKHAFICTVEYCQDRQEVRRVWAATTSEDDAKPQARNRTRVDLATLSPFHLTVIDRKRWRPCLACVVMDLFVVWVCFYFENPKGSITEVRKNGQNENCEEDSCQRLCSPENQRMSFHREASKWT